MKYIMCQPAIVRFRWQLQVIITNMLSLGIKPQDIIVLFDMSPGTQADIPLFIQHKFGVQVETFSDDLRPDKAYLPAIKPYLLWQYFTRDPQAAKQTYFYMDSDIIFREIPEFDLFTPNAHKWYGTYLWYTLDLDYLHIFTHDDHDIEKMANVAGITLKDVRQHNHECIGAQFLIADSQPEFWHKVFLDSVKMNHVMESMSSQLKTRWWAAEMWATLYNMWGAGIQAIPTMELDFAWATDPLHRYYETKIYHDSGAVDSQHGMFCKLDYNFKEPFNDDFSWVNPKLSSIKYVEAIKKVKN